MRSEDSDKACVNVLFYNTLLIKTMKDMITLKENTNDNYSHSTYKVTVLQYFFQKEDLPTA